MTQLSTSKFYEDMKDYIHNLIPTSEKAKQKEVSKEKAALLKAAMLSALASGGTTKLLGSSNKGALLASAIGGLGSYGLNKFSYMNKKASMPKNIYLRICKELALNPNAPETFFAVMSEGGKRSAAKKQYLKDNIKAKLKSLLNNSNITDIKDQTFIKPEQLDFFNKLK